MAEQTTPVVETQLTYREVAKLLGVTERTVFTLVKTGRLRAVRFGGSVRIDPADLRAFIDKSKHLPALRQGGES